MHQSTLLDAPQTARLRVHAGRAALEVDLALTPTGLLAIGALVCGILLSVPPIVRAAGEIAANRRAAGRIAAR